MRWFLIFNLAESDLFIFYFSSHTTHFFLIHVASVRWFVMRRTWCFRTEFMEINAGYFYLVKSYASYFYYFSFYQLSANRRVDKVTNEIARSYKHDEKIGKQSERTNEKRKAPLKSWFSCRFYAN